MKKFALVLGVSGLLLASCGGEMTWDQYKETCVAATKIFHSEEEANTKCDCEIAKYKEAGMKPSETMDIEKLNSVDISDCSI